MVVKTDSLPVTDGQDDHRVELQCAVYLIPEVEGGYSVIAAHLPGAMSQGETEAEALGNITEALSGIVQSYREAQQDIPWEDVGRPEHAVSRMVTIHA